MLVISRREQQQHLAVMLRKLPDAVAAADQLIAITGHPVQIPACIAIAAARASLRSWAKEI